MAVSPNTTVSRSRKKNPPQVARQETPRPDSSSSPRRPSFHLGAELLGRDPHALHQNGAAETVGEAGEFSTSIVVVSELPTKLERPKSRGLSWVRAV
jgi:hypothetical protein